MYKVKPIKYPFKSGDLGWCNIPTSTTERGNSYIVRNIFHYRNKGNDDFFITIKNDFNYTIKVNAIKFRARCANIPNNELMEIRLSNLEKEVYGKGI